MKSKPWCLTRVPAVAAALLLGSLTSACLDRPLCPGKDQLDKDCAPRTTNVIVDTLTQTSVNKIDMLFVIDNSASMGDKQAVLKEALPKLVGRLVNPVCVNSDGQLQPNQPQSPGAACASGFGREFKPLTDINIGVVTTSLGDYGATDGSCTSKAPGDGKEEKNDKGWLLGTLARGNTAIGAGNPDAAKDASGASLGFLHWGEASQEASFEASFGKLVGSANEFGCGFEATLESWYRFLVDPAPYAELVRSVQNQSEVVGPKVDATGNIVVDTQILAQRKAFLRPDSLVAVVMLTDENDCSFKISAQSQAFFLTGLYDASGSNALVAVKASTECDTKGPDDPCCFSCQYSTPPNAAACGTDVKAHGCDGNRGPVYPSHLSDALDRDRSNLRCFKQKRRFGIDYLHSVKRYINALTKQTLCLDHVDLEDDGNCANPYPNPLYDDLSTTDPKAKRGGRSTSLVFLAGIAGIPWQDLAVDPKQGAPLVYRKAIDKDNPDQGLNWDWLLGPADKRLSIEPLPDDALLHEEMLPRTGMNPALGVALAPDSAAVDANPINQHEWRADLTLGGDLQYACTFKLPTAVECPKPDINANCDCDPAFNGDPKIKNPLCQVGTTYGSSQIYAKAYPAIRELQVLYGIGLEDDHVTLKTSSNAIVASVCPKQLNMPAANDYGYNPAVTAIVDRLKEQLSEPCLPRSLSVVKTDEGAKVQCIIVEASKDAAAKCLPTEARQDIQSGAVDVAVREKLAKAGKCGGTGQPACSDLALCEIIQTTGADQKDCMTKDKTSANGWCYVDATKLEDFGLDASSIDAANSLVKQCPDTAKRKLRFAGQAEPKGGTDTFFACTGAAF